MLKKVLVTLAALIAVGVSSVFIVHAINSLTKTPGGAHAASLPAGYSQLHDGMTQKDVVGLLGKPFRQGMNPHFEQKTPAEWASIQSQVDVDKSAGGDAVNLQDIKLQGELEHRIKYLWQYKPTKLIDAVLSFDEDGKLMSYDYQPELAWSGKGPPKTASTNKSPS